MTYYGASIFHEMDPCLDGTYRESNLKYVEAIRASLNVSKPRNGDHPFVLKGIAQNTRYSDRERKAIKEFTIAKGFELFDHLKVKEEEGDRLLMVGRFKQQFRFSVYHDQRQQVAEKEKI